MLHSRSFRKNTSRIGSWALLEPNVDADGQRSPQLAGTGSGKLMPAAETWGPGRCVAVCNSVWPCVAVCGKQCPPPPRPSSGKAGATLLPCGTERLLGSSEDQAGHGEAQGPCATVITEPRPELPDGREPVLEPDCNDAVTPVPQKCRLRGRAVSAKLNGTSGIRWRTTEWFVTCQPPSA